MFKALECFKACEDIFSVSNYEIICHNEKGNPFSLWGTANCKTVGKLGKSVVFEISKLSGVRQDFVREKEKFCYE